MVFLGLGTNLGDKSANLDMARRKIEERLSVDLICSDEIKTKAVGFDGEDFLNQVVAFLRPEALEPERLLDICQEIESEMGRARHSVAYNEDGSRIYENRLIDIDILMFDDFKVCTKRLTIPHPQIWNREFVTILLQNLKTKLV